jgi:tRNA pseudouridine(38-40) synthase
LYPWIEHVDFETFKTVLALYQGTHDFTSFCKFQEKVSPIKTIDSIAVDVESERSSWLVTIKGPAFAHYQIRRMIGYALDASRNSKTAIALIKKLLTNPCHEQPYLKAAASGLTLQKIEYHDEQTN